MNKTLLILAGGFGTRLKSAVADVPKALAPVGDRPFLYLQLKNWLSLGLNHFIFSLHHESQQIIDFLKSEKQGLLKDASIEWVVEPETGVWPPRTRTRSATIALRVASVPG